MNKSCRQHWIKVKEKHKPDLVVVLSHNGIDVDKKLASRVNGIDIILGGHTHDAVPKVIEVKNNSGVTLVANSGCNGKFISVMDIKFTGKSYTYRYNLIPILSSQITPNKDMERYIDKISDPYKAELVKQSVMQVRHYIEEVILMGLLTTSYVIL